MFTFEDQDAKGQSPFGEQDMQLPYNNTGARQPYAPGIPSKV